MTTQETVKALRNALVCTPAMMDAAADLIESMAEDIQRKDEQIEAMTAELEQDKREREAAVKDFECCIAKGDDSICKYCKYRYTAAEEHCMDCDGDGFKWRGAPELCEEVKSVAEKITVLVKDPFEAWECRVIDYNLDALQELVGGYIEIVTLWDGLAMIVDEEGKLKHKELNFYLPGDTVVGTAALVGTKGDEFCNIPDDVRKMLVGRYSAIKLLTEMTIKKAEAYHAD